MEYVDKRYFRREHVTPTSNQVKMVYVASLNDQVVPLYSGLFTAASHPLILRALYIDGDAYQYVTGSAKKKKNVSCLRFWVLLQLI